MDNETNTEEKHQLGNCSEKIENLKVELSLFFFSFQSLYFYYILPLTLVNMTLTLDCLGKRKHANLVLWNWIWVLLDSIDVKSLQLLEMNEYLSHCFLYCAFLFDFL